MKIFLRFFDGVGFQLGGDGFFYGLKPLARNNALGRTQASGHGTKEMVWNAQAKDEGGRDGIAGTERKGGDGCSGAIVLRCAIEAATGSFFRYRTGFLWV